MAEGARVTPLSWLVLLLPSAETTAGLLACRGSFWQRRGGARWSETVAGVLTERERESFRSVVFCREREEKNETVAERHNEDLNFHNVSLVFSTSALLYFVFKTAQNPEKSLCFYSTSRSPCYSPMFFILLSAFQIFTSLSVLLLVNLAASCAALTFFSSSPWWQLR